MKLREFLIGNFKNDIIMKRFLERLAMVAFVAMVVFASGDTTANLMGVVAAAVVMACCQVKINTLGDE